MVCQCDLPPCLGTSVLQLIMSYPECSSKAKPGANSLEVLPEVILSLKLRAKRQTENLIDGNSNVCFLFFMKEGLSISEDACKVLFLVENKQVICSG